MEKALKVAFCGDAEAVVGTSDGDAVAAVRVGGITTCAVATKKWLGVAIATPTDEIRITLVSQNAMTRPSVLVAWRAWSGRAWLTIPPAPARLSCRGQSHRSQEGRSESATTTPLAP